jgi:hypothetical protein
LIGEAKGDAIDKVNKISAHLESTIKLIVQNSVETVLFVTFYIM